MVYQEQVMQIVRDLGGYSLGRADLVRRAMGKKKLDVMAKEREVFIHGQVDEEGNVVVPGCVRNGIDEVSANKIFDEMAEFAKYAFNKSHAAAYSVVSYRTAYLKAYYKEELMAATLNSFLGNLDKIPVYIQDCKDMDIEILKPDINESETKFTVVNNKIRFGLGTVKNVGVGAVDAIVAERNRNGKYESFTSFCERIQNESVNKKCVESLIKSGAFDCFGKTRATLLASFEGIIDTINNESKRKMENQVSMFDLFEEEETGLSEANKYVFLEKEEMNMKELLILEKEMLGVYISGHPLDKLKNKINKVSNFTSLDISKVAEEMEEFGELKSYKDGQNVKFVGIINKVNKKFTKKNTTMAFIDIEDFYGITEVITFDSVYMKSSHFLVNDNIVVVDGRLSIREDEPVKIVASNIYEFGEDFDESIFKNYFKSNYYNYKQNKQTENVDVKKQENENKYKDKKIVIDITNLNEEQKGKLRSAIRFYSKENAITFISVVDNGVEKPCGKIFASDIIFDNLKKIVESNNINLV